MKRIFYVCLILTVCISSCFAELANDTQKEKRLIIVSGTDFVEALPDTAYLSISISLEKNTPEEAASVGDALKKNIAKAIASAGVEKKDVLEDATGLSDRYDYDTKRTTSIFTYTTRLRITDFDKIAAVRKEVLNERTFAPAQESWFSKRGLSVDLQTTYELITQKNTLEREALKKACENALAKVRTIAESNGLKFIVSRIEEAGSAPVPYRQPQLFAAAKLERNDLVGSGEATVPTLQRIVSQVTVEAEIQ